MEYMESMSKEQMELKIKHLLEEKSELERQIKAGEEAKKAKTFTEDKLSRLMTMYLSV